jgi:hypothetical protein
MAGLLCHERVTDGKSTTQEQRPKSATSALIVATLSWGGGSAEDRNRGADFLDTVTDRFWAAVAD